MKTQINGIDKELLTSVLEGMENRRTANTPADEKAPKEPRAQKEFEEPREPPAHTIRNGYVITRIWANKTALGEIIWRIDQRRFRTDGWGGPNCKTYQPEHIDDAIRGLYQAKVWVKKTERRLKWRRLWL